MPRPRGLADRLVQALVPRVGAAYLRFVRRTMRLSREGADTALPHDGTPVVYCFWHEKLAMMPWVQFRPPTVVHVSRSRDGDFTAGLFARLGVEATRGSSSRGGALAARGMVAAARDGRDLGITLDGPRGPARVVQPGATWVARAAGCALLPVGFACSRYRRLGSWDRMVIPLPFSRGVFVYGEHLYVPRDTPRDELLAADQELARRVEEVTKRAETILLT